MQQYFNTGCFTAPAAFEFGDSGVGHVRGPRIVNFDISAFKRFNVTERTSLEFRAEFFNLLNDAHFDNPGNSLIRRLQQRAIPVKILRLRVRRISSRRKAQDMSEGPSRRAHR